MKKYLLLILTGLLVSVNTLTQAQETPPPIPAAKEVKNKDSVTKPDATKAQHDAIKSRRDHRRTVTHRLRRRV